MQERNADGPRASDHGITIEQVDLPAGRPFRANCLCGWQSEIIPSRTAAVAAGMEHVEGTGSIGYWPTQAATAPSADVIAERFGLSAADAERIAKTAVSLAKAIAGAESSRC
jgi:hypothetical protein